MHAAVTCSPDPSILGEIEAARALFEDFGKTMKKQASMRRMLFSYDQAIGETHNLMLQVGVRDGCAACAGQTVGGCCFEGIETGYDRILLLVNLLLNCPLPDQQEYPGSCLFVGRNGCRLRARYYFCVHYLCPDLQTRLKSATKMALRRLVGIELAAGWEVECAVRGCLGSAGWQQVNSS